MSLKKTIRAELVLAAETTSLRKIAEESGIKYHSLEYFYRGVRGLSVESLERLADVIGLVVIVRKKRSAPRAALGHPSQEQNGLASLPLIEKATAVEPAHCSSR